MIKLIKDFVHAVWVLIKLPFALIEVVYRRLKRLGWRKLTMVSVAGVVLFLFSTTTFLKVTSQPQFCSSCHIMRPFIAAWENSSHKDVDCMKCHAHEGLTGYIETKFTALSMLANYATGIYKRSKPWAEIEDKNCLECHESRLLEGKIEFTSGVTFDHEPHLTEKRRGRKLRCTSCHSQIVQGEHISVTTSTCFLCHFKNVEKEGRQELSNCTKCHAPPVGEEAIKNGSHDHSAILAKDISCHSCHQVMSQGTGDVRREQCGTCHASAEHIDKINDLEFVHEWHIEKRKVECSRCHDAITHKQPQLDKDIRSNCQGCHDDKHSPMSQLYQGIGSELIDFAMPDTMYSEGVVCVSCHKDHLTSNGKAQIQPDACTPCHDESYRTLAADWRKGFGSRIANIEKAMLKAGAHPKLENARHDLALIKNGGAWHNPKYADRLLTEISEVLSQAGAPLKRLPAVPQASKKCLTCHSSIAQSPIGLPWSEFNHAAHLTDRKVSCESCHVGDNPGKMGHGGMKPATQSCSECHHKTEAAKSATCMPCHTSSRNVYLGQLPDLPHEPSPMAASDMSCVDCHEALGYKPPDNDYCLNCHDEEVVTHLEFARGEFVIALKESKNLKSGAAQQVRLDGGRAVHHPDLAKKVLSNKKISSEQQ